MIDLDRSFLISEFWKFIREDSIAQNCWKPIGQIIDDSNYENAFPDFDIEYDGHFGFNFPFLRLESGWKVTAQWLQDDEGRLTDSFDRTFDSQSIRKLDITKCEHLACYGLWTVDQLQDIGEINNAEPYEKFEALMASRDQSLFQAYRLLAQCHVLGREGSSTPQVENPPPASYFQDIGKRGGLAKNPQMRQLKTTAIELYQQGNWKSARQASYLLKDQLLQVAKELKASPSEYSFQQTLYNWFLASHKPVDQRV